MKTLPSFVPKIDERIARFDDADRDTGRLYVALDDRGLIDGGGHYLLYGIEWMPCILGFEAHHALLRWGSPTIIQIEMPIAMT